MGREIIGTLHEGSAWLTYVIDCEPPNFAEFGDFLDLECDYCTIWLVSRLPSFRVKKGSTAGAMHRRNVRAFWRWTCKLPGRWGRPNLLEGVEAVRESMDGDTVALSSGGHELLRAHYVARLPKKDAIAILSIGPGGKEVSTIAAV